MKKIMSVGVVVGFLLAFVFTEASYAVVEMVPRGPILQRCMKQIPPGKCVRMNLYGNMECICRGVNGGISILHGKSCDGYPVVRLRKGGSR